MREILINFVDKLDYYHKRAIDIVFFQIFFKQFKFADLYVFSLEKYLLLKVQKVETILGVW